MLLHSLLAAVLAALVSPVMRPGVIRHDRFVSLATKARNDLSYGSKIEWTIPARNKQERKILERMIATAEWDGWTVVERRGNRLLLTPPSASLATK